MDLKNTFQNVKKCGLKTILVLKDQDSMMKSKENVKWSRIVVTKK